MSYSRFVQALSKHNIRKSSGDFPAAFAIVKSGRESDIFKTAKNYKIKMALTQQAFSFISQKPPTKIRMFL
jgi:hypothetical protein